jgi:hypothetical protein
LPGCLNPSCSEKHFLKNCSFTSQERKDELYAQRAQARKTNGEQRVTGADNDTQGAATRSASAASTTEAKRNAATKSLRFATDELEGRLRISFGNDKKYVALPDLGADDNTLPHSLLNELDASGLFVSRRTLEKPITVELAVRGPGQPVVVKQQAQLTVVLHLSAGPLRLRNVRWLVTENEMDEVLLGRPLLKALGLNAPAHLEAVRESYQDLD